ncbi:MAG: hypothetical protein N3G20_04865, partial [Verrucomicrobiae bacterium]|nr:hypothetical protein [Verrucomicrobiae bacterium]
MRYGRDSAARVIGVQNAALTSGFKIETNCAWQAWDGNQLMDPRKRKPNPLRKGLHMVTLPNAGFKESFITVSATGKETPTHLVKRLESFLLCHGEFRIVREDIFGEDMDSHSGRRRLELPLQQVRWPVTMVGQGNG